MEKLLTTLLIFISSLSFGQGFSNLGNTNPNDTARILNNYFLPMKAIRMPAYAPAVGDSGILFTLDGGRLYGYSLSSFLSRIGSYVGVPTLQQVLNAGSILTQDNSITFLTKNLTLRGASMDVKTDSLKQYGDFEMQDGAASYLNKPTSLTTTQIPVWGNITDVTDSLNAKIDTIDCYTIVDAEYDTTTGDITLFTKCGAAASYNYLFTSYGYADSATTPASTKIIYEVSQVALSYDNFLGTGGIPLAVTSGDLASGQVRFAYLNGVWNKYIVSIDLTNYYTKAEVTTLDSALLAKTYQKPFVEGIENVAVGSNGNTRTVIFQKPVPTSGTVKRIMVYVFQSGVFTLKRFTKSLDGLSFVWQEEINLNLSAGVNDISVPEIHFDQGDYIAYYTTCRVNFIAEPEWSQYYISGINVNISSGSTLISSLTSAGANANTQFGYEITPDARFYELSSFDKIKTTSKNLFDKEKYIDGFYLNASLGLPAPLANSAYSDYIPVEENTTYTLSGLVSFSTFTASVVVFYDASKAVIDKVSNTNNLTHTTPAGTEFVRFNIQYNYATSADFSQIQYEQGSVATSYKQFGDIIKATAVDIDTYINKSIAPITDVFMIPCYGQSLSINTSAGPSTFTDTVSICYDQAGFNNNIQDMNGGYGEMFLALSKEFKILNPNFWMMTCLGGAGGLSVLELSKGSTQYTNLMNNIIAGRNTALGLGKSYNVPAFVWTQGEEDYRANGAPWDYGSGDWDASEYAEKLKTLINDINTDVKLITGQKNDVKCVMYQTGSHNAYYRYPTVAHQQLKLAVEDERVTLAKTMYDVDYNIVDYVHAPAKTYRNMGNYYGIALYNVIMNNKRVKPINPIQHFVVGNDIYVKFHVPVGPLSFDTTLVNKVPDGNYGFKIYDVTNETEDTSGTITAGVTINSVTIVADDLIKISCASAPVAGTRLTYGVNGDYWQNVRGLPDVLTGGEGPNGIAKSGRLYGARGNLRDNQTYMNPVSNYFILYNWCPFFEIIL